MTAAVLVIGLGNVDRGDDGIGPAVAKRVGELGLDGVSTVVCDSPLRLLDAWEGYDRVVVVDAVRSGAAPGTVTVLDAQQAASGRVSGVGGSHAFGLGSAIQLAQAMDRLPARVVVVGVEATDFRHGSTLSDAAVASLREATAAAVAAAGKGRR